MGCHLLLPSIILHISHFLHTLHFLYICPVPGTIRNKRTTVITSLGNRTLFVGNDCFDCIPAISIARDAQRRFRDYQLFIMRQELYVDKITNTTIQFLKKYTPGRFALSNSPSECLLMILMMRRRMMMQHIKILLYLLD